MESSCFPYSIFDMQGKNLAFSSDEAKDASPNSMPPTYAEQGLYIRKDKGIIS